MPTKKKDNTKTYTIVIIGIGALALAGIGVAKIITSYPVDTIKTIRASLKKYGITNPFTQAGILAVVSTEHGFVPKSEMSYRNTAASRIRAIFGSRFSKYTDAQIDALKVNDPAFYDVIYGGQYGNGISNGDGFKYRGRGFNGITFRNTYSTYGLRIGKDLITNPDLLNTVPVAAEVLAAFFADGFKGKVDANSFKTLADATWNAFRVNAGWGTNIAANTVLMAEHQKQLANGPELLQIVQQA